MIPDRVKPGARVVVKQTSLTGGDVYVVRARALDRELAGYQLAQVEGDEGELRLLLMYEGLTWARGWSTKAANALRVSVAL